MYRIAISKRLSRADDDSTSFDVQERHCRSALSAAGLDGEIKVFEDYGVSGASSLESRKGMTELREWGPTHVIAWKIDRYARSMAEFLALVKWADEHGVVLMTADGTLNTGTPSGRLVATILVALAEWERGMIASRILDGHAERRAQGRWASGKPPWPYTAETRDGGRYLVEDGEAFALAREAIDDLLNREGTVTSTAKRLPVSAVRWRVLLRGPILLGFREYKGAVITESDGVTPKRYGPPVIDAAVYSRVQARLDELAVGDRIRRHDAPWLSGMLWCMCGAPMDGSTTRGKPQYQCREGHTAIMASVVHPAVEAAFLAEFGDTELMHVTYEGGTDHSAELAALEAQRARIVEAIANVEGPAVKPLSARLTALEERYEVLSAAHDPVAREVRTATGHNLADAWEGSTDEGQRRLLRDHGLRVEVGPAKGGRERLVITWGDSEGGA